MSSGRSSVIDDSSSVISISGGISIPYHFAFLSEIVCVCDVIPVDRANAVKAQVMIPVFMSYSESTEKLKPKLPLLDFPVKYRKAFQE